MLAIIGDENQWRCKINLHLSDRFYYRAEFSSINGFLADLNPWGFHFYVINLANFNIEELGFIKAICKNTTSKIIVVGFINQEWFLNLPNDYSIFFVDESINLQELDAAIGNIHQEHAYQEHVLPSLKNEVWMLNFRECFIITPNDLKVNLRPNEAALLGCFSKENNFLASRYELYASVSLNVNNKTQHGYFNSLMYRLKQKIKFKSGIHIPLYYKNNTGYSFEGILFRLDSRLY